jgi:hypothetical protein
MTSTTFPRPRLLIIVLALLALTACGRSEDGAGTAAQAATALSASITPDASTPLPAPPTAAAAGVEPAVTPSPEVPLTTPVPPSRPLVDAQHPPAVAGQDGYDYQQVAMADFDGDGVQERAFLIANTVVENGQPLWDDGHVWQLYIEEPSGERTYLFVRFVQLGIVEAKLTQSEAGEVPQILLIERWPRSFNVYELRYRGPDAVEARVLVERELVPYPDGFLQP